MLCNRFKGAEIGLLSSGQVSSINCKRQRASCLCREDTRWKSRLCAMQQDRHVSLDDC